MAYGDLMSGLYTHSFIALSFFISPGSPYASQIPLLPRKSLPTPLINRCGQLTLPNPRRLVFPSPSPSPGVLSIFNTHYLTSSLTNNQDWLSGCLGGSVRHTIPLCPSRTTMARCRLFRWDHCCPSLSTWRCSHRLCMLPLTGQVTVFARSRSEGRRSWSRAPYLLRCRPLRTIRPPPPTVSAELQWGELRRGAFGTCARVAGSFSISEWSVLLSSGQPLVLAVCGRSISKWQHFGY